MRIAVSSKGMDLSSQIDPRFGRCAYFLIVETNDLSFEAFENENIALGGGAGIQSAQLVASKDTKVVITGNCGPNAVKTLEAAGVQLFVGSSGTVKNGIERFKNNELRPIKEANVSDHFGMKGEYTPSQPQVDNVEIGQPSRRGMGMGMGGGRGMGRGMGMGRGRGRGRSGIESSKKNSPRN